MSALIITDPNELARTPIRIGDLVTERVTDVGAGTDNGHYDGTVVRIEREEVPKSAKPGTFGHGTVYGVRYPGFIDEDPTFNFVNELGEFDYVDVPADFEPARLVPITDGAS